MVNKVVRDGMVAVLISPGYGSPWSECSYDRGFAMFDSRLVEAVENGVKDERVIGKIFADAGMPIPYMGGWEQVEIIWVMVGSEFRITDSDGCESIEYKEDIFWSVA